MAGEGADQQDDDAAGWEREALGCLGDGCLFGCLPLGAGLSVVFVAAGHGLWQAVHPYFLG
ncbi:hypothetical protein ASD67_07960 [Sphingopyxis sp. Root1497]|nr:hypothetical protein ASD67_07960 [Sphingopyxis sp. Root1497]